MSVHDTIWGRKVHPSSMPRPTTGTPALPKTASGLFYHSKNHNANGGYYLAQGAKVAGLQTSYGPGWIIANDTWIVGLIFSSEGQPLRPMSPEELAKACTALTRRFSESADAGAGNGDGLQAS